jgi:hypothetical protein
LQITFECSQLALLGQILDDAEARDNESEIWCKVEALAKRVLAEPRADQPAATEAAQAGVCPNCGYGPVIALPAPTETKLPTPEQDAIAREMGCYIDPDHVTEAAVAQCRISPENQLPCSHCGAPDHTARWHGARISPEPPAER